MHFRQCNRKAYQTGNEKNGAFRNMSRMNVIGIEDAGGLSEDCTVANTCSQHYFILY